MAGTTTISLARSFSLLAWQSECGILYSTAVNKPHNTCSQPTAAAAAVRVRVATAPFWKNTGWGLFEPLKSHDNFAPHTELKNICWCHQREQNNRVNLTQTSPQHAAKVDSIRAKQTRTQAPSLSLQVRSKCIHACDAQRVRGRLAYNPCATCGWVRLAQRASRIKKNDVLRDS